MQIIPGMSDESGRRRHPVSARVSGGGGGLDAAVDATMRSREHLMALDRIAQMRTSSEHARHQSNA
jgi:hypothetical protein